MCKLIEGLQNIAKNEALFAMRLAYSMDEEGTACIDDIKLQVDIAKEMMEVYLACEKEIFDRWKSGSIEELLKKAACKKTDTTQRTESFQRKLKRNLNIYKSITQSRIAHFE